jgi:hypothetical protein
MGLSGLKTFFEKVWAELKKLFKSGATWEKVAQSVITYAAPLVETIVGLAAGTAAEALVTRIINTVQSDMATVSVVAQGAAVAPGSTDAATVEAALNSIKTNLSELLEAAEVKSAATGSKITAAANLIIGEVEALLSNLPQTTTPATPAA